MSDGRISTQDTLAFMGGVFAPDWRFYPVRDPLTDDILVFAENDGLARSFRITRRDQRDNNLERVREFTEWAKALPTVGKPPEEA